MFKLYNNLVHGQESICVQEKDDIYIYINDGPFKRRNKSVQALQDTFGFGCYYNIRLMDEYKFKALRGRMER